MGTLEIVSEKVLLEIPRGQKLLRVTRVQALTYGTPTEWHVLCVFFRAEDGWQPTKSKITVRHSEVEQVVAALTEIPGRIRPL